MCLYIHMHASVLNVSFYSGSHMFLQTNYIMQSLLVRLASDILIKLLC